MKKSFLFVRGSLFLFYFVYCCLTNYAQVSLSASGGTTSGSYTTLGSAFNAINSGTHTGNISITITNNLIESSTAILNASGTGSATYSSILIEPSGGVSRTIFGNFSNAPLLDFNGCDDITIDGLNTGGNNLILINSSTGDTNTSVIRFINDSKRNIIQNCTIQGSTTSEKSGVILFSKALNGNASVGNDSNTINNCNITGRLTFLPTNLIYCMGTDSIGKENSDNLISNNYLSNFFSSIDSSNGIYIAKGGTKWKILNN